MPLHEYGVLKGRAVSSRLGAGQSPHYQIHLVDETTDYRVAINVKSKLSPSELLYVVDDDFRHPTLPELETLGFGFTLLAARSGGHALDFVRGNLFDRGDLRALPHAVPGPDNDLNEKIDAYVGRAIADEDAEVYAFGERWGPEPGRKDRYFGFLPGNGIHDIHMNQGNVERFVRDDGVWQDGALLVHYPAILDADGLARWPDQWVGIFLAFQSQSWHTDDTTGHALTVEAPSPAPSPVPTPAPTPRPGDRDGQIRIVAALANPSGDDVGLETVTIVNASPVPVSLGGWSLSDRHKRRSALPDRALAPGETLRIDLDGTGVQLGNKGGIISVLDDHGVKVDGVAYTREMARRQGWTLVF